MVKIWSDPVITPNPVSLHTPKPLSPCIQSTQNSNKTDTYQNTNTEQKIIELDYFP